MSPRVLLTILCLLALVGCQGKPDSSASKDVGVSEKSTDSEPDKRGGPAQREETATRIHNDLVVRLQKGERDITVVVDDIGKYLKEPDAPKRQGPVKFVSSGRLKQVSGQSWVEASYFRTYNDFRLGYVLQARLMALPGDRKEIEVRELADVTIRYTDDLLEARDLNEQAIVRLIEQLAEPANKVEWSFSVVPGGEILRFSTPMKRLILLGGKARLLLEQHLGDPKIQNEVALVLGAIGDETTVPLLIDAYPTVDVRERMKQPGLTTDPDRLKVVCLTFALTYLTGEPIGRSRWGTDCDPENLKRWQEWWDKSKDTFKVPKQKPNATWVPSYPLLSEQWAQLVRQEFAKANE
jgi:hypothetical protein